jgi:hypothetical protein
MFEIEFIGTGIAFPCLRVHESMRGIKMPQDNAMTAGRVGQGRHLTPYPLDL